MKWLSFSITIYEVTEQQVPARTRWPAPASAPGPRPRLMRMRYPLMRFARNSCARQCHAYILCRDAIAAIPLTILRHRRVPPPARNFLGQRLHTRGLRDIET